MRTEMWKTMSLIFTTKKKYSFNFETKTTNYHFFLLILNVKASDNENVCFQNHKINVGSNGDSLSMSTVWKVHKNSSNHFQLIFWPRLCYSKNKTTIYAPFNQDINRRQILNSLFFRWFVRSVLVNDS